MAADLQNPIFHDEAKAREAFEAIMWPHGPVCPRCSCTGRIGAVKGKSHRPGLYYCGDCKGQFTVTVGTVFERSKVPLSKWWLAAHLLSASKKGMSSVQISRMLGVTQKTAWFMMHRIREAMRELHPGPLGGANEVVEVDKTYVGGKAKNRAFKAPPPKEAVVALVERDGRVRGYHVADVNAAGLPGSLLRRVADHAQCVELYQEPSRGRHREPSYPRHADASAEASAVLDLGRPARPCSLSSGKQSSSLPSAGISCCWMTASTPSSPRSQR